MPDLNREMNPRRKKSMSERGKLLVISGPSGTGKSTVIGHLMKLRPGLEFSVSATTRAPRPGEVDGREYFFVTHDRFAEMVDNNELLEHASFVGNHYGTPRSQVEKRLEQGITVILDIEVQGAAQVKAAMPEAVTVFLAPPSLEVLEQRLRGRGTETEEKIRSRLETARQELLLAPTYDFTVINDDAERAAREIRDILELPVKE
jgi:guanylate kinase